MRGCCSRGSGNGRETRRTFTSRRSSWDSRPGDFGRDNCFGRRPGILGGGFQWLSGWLGLPLWVVVAFFVVLFLTIGWPALVIYLACALLLRPEPQPKPLYGESRTASQDRGIRLDQEARDVRDRTRDLDARIGRLESHVTSKEFDFDRRLSAPGRDAR